jgi:hypothetical protein
MPEHAGSTLIGYEVANALGELNRSRPRLAARVDAQRGGLASYAYAAKLLLHGIDLFCEKYAIREPSDVGRLQLVTVRKPYGMTVMIEMPPERRRLRTAVGSARALEVVSERITVGSEMGGREMAWLLARMKRVQEWASQDNIADAIEELFHAIDRHCDINVVDPRFLTVDGIFARGLRYVDLTFTDDTPDRHRRR